jgi:hypothetical protein
LQTRVLRYWRDKRGHEVDLVLGGDEGDPVAVECKWKADAFDPASLLAFRRRYPAGANYVVASDISRSWTRRYGAVAVRFVALRGLVEGLQPR